MDNKTICKNCNSETSGGYCSNCGQRTTIHKVTFKETFQDLMEIVFSINSPLFLTIKLLITNPGKLFNNYLNGKRKTYYKPVPFFILTTIVYVLIKTILNYDPMQNMVQAEHESIDVSLMNNAGIYMAQNINNIIFTFVFSFALTVKLFFYKRYSLAEYVAISFYIIGFYIFITTALMFGLQYYGDQYKMLPFILMFFYIIYALTSLFQKRKVFTILKIVLVYIISVIFYMVFGFGISFLIVWMKTL